jgi:hypothetical protein
MLEKLEKTRKTDIWGKYVNQLNYEIWSTFSYPNPGETGFYAKKTSPGH